VIICGAMTSFCMPRMKRKTGREDKRIAFNIYLVLSIMYSILS